MRRAHPYPIPSHIAQVSGFEPGKCGATTRWRPTPLTPSSRTARLNCARRIRHRRNNPTIEDSGLEADLIQMASMVLRSGGRAEQGVDSPETSTNRSEPWPFRFFREMTIRCRTPVDRKLHFLREFEIHLGKDEREVHPFPEFHGLIRQSFLQPTLHTELT